MSDRLCLSVFPGNSKYRTGTNRRPGVTLMTASSEGVGESLHRPFPFTKVESGTLERNQLSLHRIEDRLTESLYGDLEKDPLKGHGTNQRA